jgi:spore germination protein KA
MLNYPSKEAIDKLNQQSKDAALQSNIDQSIALFKDLFKDDDTFITRYFNNKSNPDLKFCIFYMDGLVNSEFINEDIIKPLMLGKIEDQGKNLMDTLRNEAVLINEVTKTSDMQQIIEAVTYGDTILITDGVAEALILNSKDFRLRSITEPTSEQIISGPREGFNESLMVNLSMIHRRIRSNDLKMKFQTFGERTKTRACVCYIDSLVDKQALDELYRRLNQFDVDCVLDAEHLAEMIKDNKWSPYRTTGVTERPDVVVGKILEGRIAVFLDGTPVVLTVPYLFIENFQSNEDYYLNFYYASFQRVLRIFGFFLTVITPAFYITAVAYHHEMLPTQLFISISAERMSVPLPAAVEAVLLLIMFDIIKEAGIRMPSNIGQALSIVGALVIGQAAVEAKLVAAPMIIIVALTAITNLLIPKINAAAMITRYLLLILSSAIGFFGLVIGLSFVLIHLLSLRSFGMPYLSPIDRMPFRAQELKDVTIRAPWFKMKQRPVMAADKTRMKTKQSGDQN